MFLSQWANSALNESGDNSGWPLKCHSQKFGGSAEVVILSNIPSKAKLLMLYLVRGNFYFLEILPNNVLIKGKVYKHNLLF